MNNMVGLQIGGDQENPMMRMDSREPNVEFQKYVTDLDYLKMNFRKSLCGWKFKIGRNKTEILGQEMEYFEENYDIIDSARYINEIGSDSMAEGLDGLIGRVTQTSNIDPMLIFRQWDGWSDALIYSLLTSYYVDKNPYEIKIEHFDRILAKPFSYYSITFKAVGGFYTKQNTNTIISTYNQNMRMEHEMQQKRSLRERLGMQNNNSQ